MTPLSPVELSGVIPPPPKAAVYSMQEVVSGLIRNRLPCSQTKGLISEQHSDSSFKDNNMKVNGTVAAQGDTSGEVDL